MQSPSAITPRSRYLISVDPYNELYTDCDWLCVCVFTEFHALHKNILVLKQHTFHLQNNNRVMGVLIFFIYVPLTSLHPIVTVFILTFHTDHAPFSLPDTWISSSHKQIIIEFEIYALNIAQRIAQKQFFYCMFFTLIIKMLRYDLVFLC